MVAEVMESKTGTHHLINVDYVKMFEFTKGSLRIVWKDARTDDTVIKSTQIIFKGQ